MGKISLNPPRYGKEVVGAVVVQKVQTNADPPVSIPSSVTIGDRVSVAAAEAERLMDDYLDNYQSLAYTLVNPEMGRVEPITLTLSDMSDDSEEPRTLVR